MPKLNVCVVEPLVAVITPLGSLPKGVPGFELLAPPLPPLAPPPPPPPPPPQETHTNTTATASSAKADRGRGLMRKNCRKRRAAAVPIGTRYHGFPPGRSWEPGRTVDGAVVLIVTVVIPLGAFAETVMEAGEKLQLLSAGSPVQEVKLTVPLKPPT